VTGAGTPAGIADLDRLVAALPGDEQARFERIFEVSVTTGRTVPPETMDDWLAGHFGSVEAVRQQRIVRVTNRVLGEGSLFNQLRAQRPLQAGGEDSGLEEKLEASAGGPFCRPREGTPADVFGRVEGAHCLTASNVAKYDGWHTVVIFEDHHPLHFDFAQFCDYLDTAQRWARAAHEADPEARYPFFLWNCLWRSGASILHGHAQMTLTRGSHYARVESWRRAARAYRAEHGADYFADVVAVHRALGLALEQGQATILASLTPFKEKEIHVVGHALDDDMKAAIYFVMRTAIDRLGVSSFNAALYQPPLAPTPEDWGGFPLVFRFLDRGDLSHRTSDLGAMEIFAQSVVATDPFRLARALTDALAGGQAPAKEQGA
jgi:hypothetical protein